MAADHAQLGAVERPAKVGDLFRFEVGDLLSRRTVERLEPEVIGILVTEGINDSFAIVGEADRPPAWALQVVKFRVLGLIEWEQCQLVLGGARGCKRPESCHFAVWRNFELVCGKLGESFRLPSIQRHLV